MLNLGGAKVKLQLEIEKTLTDLREAIKLFEGVSKTSDESTKFGRAFVSVMKEEHKALRKVIGSSYTYKGAVTKVNAAIERQIGLINKLRTATALSNKQPLKFSTMGRGAGYGAETGFGSLKPQVGQSATSGTASSIKNSQTQFSSLNGQIKGTIATITNFRGAYGKISGVMTRVNAVTRKANQTFTAMTPSLNKTGNAAATMGHKFNRALATMRKFYAGGDAWWKRFGGVAAGFWIAYRAINAVEIAISNLTSTFVSGTKVMDDYKAGIATVGGMLALLSSGQDGFKNRFVSLKEVMKETMMESARLAPVFKLSMDEIAEGYKELAQFGVVVTKDITAKTLTSLAMIREIAHTTGSSARQLRQEIQSLFNGATRVTDQFGRFLKRMPEFKDALYGIARANTTNAEKWKLVIDRMYEFRYAIYESVQTVTGQFEVMRNSLSIISGLAQNTSGVYASWVVWLTHFNKSLFNTKGELNDVGKELYSVFYGMWDVISRIPIFLGEMYDVLADIYSIVVEILKPYSKQLEFYGKALGVAFAMSLAWSAISITVSLLLFPLKKVWLLIAGAATAALTLWKYWAMFLTSIFPVVAAIAAAVAGGIALGAVLNATIGITVGIGSAFNKLGLIIIDLGWLMLHPISMFGKEGEKVIERIKNNFVSMFTVVGSTSAKYFNDFVGDTKSLVTDMMTSTVDGITNLVEGSYEYLKKQLAEKFPSLAMELKKVVFPENLKADTEALLKGIMFTDGGAGVGRDDKKAKKAKAPVDKSIMKWLKLIEDMNTEISNMPLDQFDKKVGSIGNKYAKIRMELVESAKTNKKLLPYVAEIMALTYSREASLKDQVSSERALYDLAQTRFGIEKKLRDVKTSYDNYGIDTGTKLSQELALRKQLLASAYADLRIKESATVRDQAAIDQQKNLITNSEESYRKSGVAFDKYNRSITESLKNGLQNYTREFEDTAKLLENITRDVADAMQSSLSDAFFDFTKGELDSLEDYFRSFADSISRILSDVLSQLAVSGLTSIIRGAFPSTPMVKTSGVASSGKLAGADRAYASGGWINEPVFGTGMNSGKTYSFAENSSEYVATSNDMRAIGGRGGSRDIAINIINKTEQPMEAAQGRVSFDGDQYVVDVILNKLANDPAFRSNFGR